MHKLSVLPKPLNRFWGCTSFPCTTLPPLNVSYDSFPFPLHVITLLIQEAISVWLDIICECKVYTCYLD